VAVVAILFWVATRLLVQQSYFEFAQNWNQYHPGRPDVILAGQTRTIAYGCGWATLTMLVCLLLPRLFRRAQHGDALREALAWGVATMPLWTFWLLHPPMSTRHALPGILVTSILATLVASRLFPRPMWIAPLWLAVVLGGNALFGTPGFDINYDPSGRLLAGLRMNQRAYAVGTEIARAVAGRQENVKVVFGELQPSILGGLDFHPMIEFALACQARTVRCQSRYGAPRDLHDIDPIFTDADGHTTKLYRVTDFRRQRAYQAEDTAFYAPWGTGNHKMYVPVMQFDPQQLYRQVHR
jgi:hypothetical protein